MNKVKRSEHLQKIIDGMDLVYERLIEFKRKNNSELVILRNGRIIKIKP